MCLRCIFEEQQIVLAAELAYADDVCQLPVQVHGHYGASPRGHRPCQRLRRHVEGDGADICKPNGEVRLRHCERRCYEGIRRDDDFVLR